MKQIFHHYKLWEDYKHGFYNNLVGDSREVKIKSVIRLFSSEKMTIEYMTKVIELWPYSCDQYLSNPHINKIAYIGQAACCIYNSVPNLVTMEAWRSLDNHIKLRADNIAKSIINLWKQGRQLNSTSINGRKEVIQMGYQMKLLEN